MGELIELRRMTPPAHLVCGLYVVLVDSEWWVCRWSTGDERRTTGLHFQTIGGPEDTRNAAERCARRLALRPVAAPKENHDS